MKQYQRVNRNLKQILLTSNSTNTLNLRNPYDLMNLALLMNINFNTIQDILSIYPQQLLSKGSIKNTLRGVVQLSFLSLDDEK